MPDNIMQTAMQAYIKLVQANVDLLTTFWTSPEMVSQAAASAQSMFRQGQNSTTSAARSSAFAQLAQGMLKNYTEFLTEVGQAGMEAMAQGRAALTRHVQTASEHVVEAQQSAGAGVRKTG